MKANNVCTSKFWHAVFMGALVLLSCLISIPEASAQNYRAQIKGANGRTFPGNAFRGILMVEKYPLVKINGKSERLVPGTRILDDRNRIVTPARLTGKRYVVNYVRFANGQLNAVWLLTKQEAKERRKVEEPNWWEKAKENFFDWASVLGGLGALL